MIYAVSLCAPMRRVVVALAATLLAPMVLASAGASPAWGQATAHPSLASIPQFTITSRGLPGDPVNIAFIGTEEELHMAMIDAKWFPADPITLKTSTRLVADTLAHRQYADAPVSPLYLWGRKQDLAFEQPVGNSPKQRHHVRFWRSAEVDVNGKPMWIGAATFDTRIEISRTTLLITHRIAPNIDFERDKLLSDAETSGEVASVFWVEGFHTTHEGRNGGGDPYFTDGRLAVGVLDVRR